MLRQLFDTVNGKYQKSKKIAADSNYSRCHALLTALHFPLETTWSCEQDRKERYWGQQFWQMERDISSLRSKRFQSSYCAKVRAEAKKRLKGSFVPLPLPRHYYFFFALVPAF